MNQGRHHDHAFHPACRPRRCRGGFAFGAATDARAQAVDKLTIVIFSPPSLGALLPPVIKAQKFDIANGLDITFEERTPDAYATQFNSGEFKIGGSASLTTMGLADVRGVKVKYLFNLFDYWGTVVTSRDNVKTLKDLEGKELAGARSTTNYQMSEFFEKQAGRRSLQDQGRQHGAARPDQLRDRRPRRRDPDLGAGLHADDRQEVEHPHHRSQHRQDLEGFHRRRHDSLSRRWRALRLGRRQPRQGAEALHHLQAAVEWVQKNPDEAAPLLAKGAPPEELKAVAAMIKSNERLAMKLTKAGEIKKDIQAVYKAGMEINYLPSMPSDASIYDKPLK